MLTRFPKRSVTGRRRQFAVSLYQLPPVHGAGARFSGVAVIRGIIPVVAPLLNVPENILKSPGVSMGGRRRPTRVTEIETRLTVYIKRSS